MSVRAFGTVLVLSSMIFFILAQGVLICDPEAEAHFLNAGSYGEEAVPLPSEVDLGQGPGSVTVTWSYENENGLGNSSCPQALVDLISAGNSDEVLAEATTDLNGSVSFRGLHLGQYEVVIHAEDQDAVEVLNGSQTDHEVYSWSTGPLDVSGPIDITEVIRGPGRGAWNAYDALRSAASWLEAEVDWARDKASVLWPAEEWPHSHGDSIHIPAASETHDFIWDDYTLMHEYGHCVHYAARGNDFPEMEGPDPHYIDSESSGPFAFVEGWAEFFACAVLDRPKVTAGTSLESTVYADAPLHNGDYGDWDGNEVEGAVANVLWDIYDGISAEDHPSWDHSGYGDGIDHEFAKFWEIFINDQPESMDDVWSSWEEKNESLAYVFKHARFDKEVTLPTNPSNYVASIEVGILSNDSSINVSWSGAADPGSGIAGYSILWDHSPQGEPDQYIDVYGSTIQTSNMSAGAWYLHIRAVDNSGNAANGSYDIGPFLISSKASDAAGGGDLFNGVGEIALVAVLAVALVLLLWLVSRVVRKPTKEDVEPYVPPWRPYQYNPYYAPPYPYSPYTGMPTLPPVMPNAPYPPPMPPGYPAQQSQGPVIRYCHGCGRPDSGGQFCPYCGTKVR